MQNPTQNVIRAKDLKLKCVSQEWPIHSSAHCSESTFSHSQLKPVTQRECNHAWLSSPMQIYVSLPGAASMTSLQLAVLLGVWIVLVLFPAGFCRGSKPSSICPATGAVSCASRGSGLPVPCREGQIHRNAFQQNS